MTLNLWNISTYLSSLHISIEHISQPDLLQIALTHKSYAADFTTDHPHNERLEFLGDSVVWLVINHLLYLEHPHESESILTLYKIALVRQETLAQAARHISLDQHILLGKGEQRKWWNNNDAILCDCFEAFVWWIYLDLGRESAYQFIKTHVYSLKDNLQVWPIKSYKSLIQEHVQSQYKTLPEYTDRELSRNDHRNEVVYETTITINGEVAWIGTGSSKRKAQEEAAKAAYEAIVKA